jgi:hypothetical protein
MQRVTRSTAVAVQPAVPASPGTPGFFSPGNPGGGLAATVPGYEWFNMVQEELIGVILRAGLTPDAADQAQLRKALDRLHGGGLRTLTANTTLTADDAGLVLVDASGGSRTITLPAANVAGGRPIRWQFVRTDTTAANTVTIQRAGGDAIEGAVSRTMLPGERLSLVSDGVAAWRVLAGAGRLIGVQVFSAAGTATYTPTPGTTSVLVEAVGGGGAGAGAPATGVGQGAVGGAGSAGTYGRGRYTSGFAGVTVTVGAGGTPAAGASGGAGGTSSFGPLLSAPGGPGGGAAGPGAPPLIVGVFGGSAPVGSNMGGGAGASGQASTQHTVTLGAGGAGGSGPYGGGGAQNPAGSDGAAANGPGSGGGGTANSQSFAVRTGGAGAAGIVIVWEFG